MAGVRLSNVSKRFGDVTAVDNVVLDIGDREFMVLLGPSGCGKSTLLRMIAGLEEASEGEIWIGDQQVNDVAPKLRDIAMVFQSYALYPHKTVQANIEFPLKARGVGSRERAHAAREAAQVLGLSELMHRKPGALSRRPAPAGRPGPRHRPQSGRVPDGRAAVEPGRQAPR